MLTARVRGCKRVPDPPARIIPFIGVFMESKSRKFLLSASGYLLSVTSLPAGRQVTSYLPGRRVWRIEQVAYLSAQRFSQRAQSVKLCSLRPLRSPAAGKLIRMAGSYGTSGGGLGLGS